MTVSQIGSTQSDTIMSGVIFLVETGQWPLALLIFFASVVVPILKLLILGALLLSVQFKLHWQALDRTKLYRFTEKVGRWSMVDIYVVTILVALVQLGAVATIEAEMGAIFFGAVVVLTMFAANAFDPRLIWDKAVTNGKDGK
jgi:paraquat-inducible protein A